VLFHYDGAGVDQNGDAVRFTAPSGARVFASGAQQFAWALDDWRSDGTLFPEPPIQPWQGVPVDPRLQRFMRNAIEDLTRPAAPGGVTAARRGVRIEVSVARGPDPRVVGFLAAARVDGHWRALCRGTTTCVSRRPLGPGTATVAVFAVDVWHRRSAPSVVVVPGQA